MGWPDKVPIFLDICAQHFPITKGPDQKAVVGMETWMGIVQTRPF
jgi:hypothetical protein